MTGLCIIGARRCCSELYVGPCGSYGDDAAWYLTAPPAAYGTCCNGIGCPSVGSGSFLLQPASDATRSIRANTASGLPDLGAANSSDAGQMLRTANYVRNWVLYFISLRAWSTKLGLTSLPAPRALDMLCLLTLQNPENSTPLFSAQAGSHFPYTVSMQTGQSLYVLPSSSFSYPGDQLSLQVAPLVRGGMPCDLVS